MQTGLHRVRRKVAPGFFKVLLFSYKHFGISVQNLTHLFNVTQCNLIAFMQRRRSLKIFQLDRPPKFSRIPKCCQRP